MKSLFFCMFSHGEPIPESWPGLREIAADPYGKVIANDDILGVKVTSINLCALIKQGEKDLAEYNDRTAIKAVEEYFEQGKADILIVGQTVTGDKIVRQIRTLHKSNQPLAIARFSMYYGERSAPYAETMPPAESGYNLDIYKDYNILWCFLTFVPIIEAVAHRRPSFLRKAIEEYNKTISKPILILNL